MAKLAKRSNTAHVLASDGQKTCDWKQELYPCIVESPKSDAKLHIESTSLQLEDWDKIMIEYPHEIAPLVITSDPIPTTTATVSDLIASHVDSKEFH